MQKTHKYILIAVLVILAIVGGYKVFGSKGSSPSDVVVTELPITGYSIMDDDMPSALPMELPAADDVITNTPAPALPTSLPTPEEPEPAEVKSTETFVEYAPRRWRGELL